MTDETAQDWPELPIDAWKDTCATIHMVSQIVGKIRLALTPPVNHWWHVPLYVGGCGLTTSAIPYRGGVFEIELDFRNHEIVFTRSDGRVEKIGWLPARAVADYYAQILAAVTALDVDVRIWPMPVEIPDPIRFDTDREHASYDPEYAGRFWRVLTLAQTVMREFRSPFLGKCSPIHFFWGSFDLAVTRFSGRRAPEREGADAMTREAYSHEVSSVGFWPGRSGVRDAVFYSYMAPEPPGFSDRPVRPAAAAYDSELKEFLLPYAEVRRAPSPGRAVLDFFQSTYEAGADLAAWDRAALER